MKTTVRATSDWGFREVEIDKPYWEVIDDIRKGEFDLQSVCDQEVSFLYDKKVKCWRIPSEFVIVFDSENTIVEIYDYYRE